MRQQELANSTQRSERSVPAPHQHAGSTVGAGNASDSGDERPVDLARLMADSAAFVPRTSPRRPTISVVITAHNEGEELRRTVASVVEQTRTPHEIILVDDGSTDGSSRGLSALGVRVIERADRVGVADSRNTGCDAARGDVFAFLDGHQRLSPGCLDECARLAVDRQAVVWPDVLKLDGQGWTGHGATFQLCRKQGYFSARWRHEPPDEPVTQINALMAPGYLIPRAVYRKVRWIGLLRGWGGSEAAVGIKAFFQDVPLLHVCGPQARHLFRGDFHYATTWASVWRNQALIARVCFSGDTWQRYWLPHVFDRHLSVDVVRELESPQVRQEHREFQQLKTRSDDEFWTCLLRQPVPDVLRADAVGL